MQLPLYLSIYELCVQAVGALEQYNVVHYDIKADNLLLGEDIHHLIDFGVRNLIRPTTSSTRIFHCRSL